MNNIGICGAGLIGASWAIGFANAGFKCKTANLQRIRQVIS